MSASMFCGQCGGQNWIRKLAVIPQNDKSVAVFFDSVNQEVIVVCQGSL